MQEENLNEPAREQASGDIGPVEEVNKAKGERKIPWTMISMILNVILLAGLIILYVMFFRKEKSTEAGQVLPVATKITAGGARVVYVNLDSLNEKYEFVKNLRGDLESTGKRLQNEILSEQASFEKEAADFQKQVQSNSISEERAKVVYEGLMQKQQLLAEKKDRYTQQVADKEMNMNMQLLDTVTNFLKRYNRTLGYDYILGYKAGGEILLASDSLEITREVVRILNEEYRQRKK